MTDHADTGPRPAGWAEVRQELRSLVALAAPLALAQLGQIAINTTDLVMMGWLGTEALAAGGLAMSLWIVAALFGIGLASATAPLIAQALAVRRARPVRRAVRQGLWVVFAFTLPAALVLANAAGPLAWLGQSPATAAGAEAYLRAAAAGLPFAAGFVVLRSFLASFGNTRAILVVTAATVVGNAISNYLLMFGHFGLPRLELVGAGLSSTLVNLLGFLALAVVAARRQPYRRFRLFGRFWRPDWVTFGTIVRLGLPIGLTLLFEVGMFSAAALLVGTQGTVPLAAHNVAMQVCGIVFMVPLGLSQAATIRIALAAGVHDAPRVRRVAMLAVGMAVLIMVVPAIAFWTVGAVLVAPFVDDPVAQRELHVLAVRFLAVAAVFQLVDGLQIVVGGLLRGLRDTLVPMVYAFVGYWLVGLGSGAFGLFVLDLGALAVWFGLALGLATTACLGLARLGRLAGRG